MNDRFTFTKTNQWRYTSFSQLHLALVVNDKRLIVKTLSNAKDILTLDFTWLSLNLHEFFTLFHTLAIFLFCRYLLRTKLKIWSLEYLIGLRGLDLRM